MRPPRFRVRLWMLMIAIVAVAVLIEVERERKGAGFREQARHYAAVERRMRVQERSKAAWLERFQSIVKFRRDAYSVGHELHDWIARAERDEADARREWEWARYEADCAAALRRHYERLTRNPWLRDDAPPAPPRPPGGPPLGRYPGPRAEAPSPGTIAGRAP